MSVSVTEITSSWLKNYEKAPLQLGRMSEVRGLVSAFNANIDAVKKVKPATFQKWMLELGHTPEVYLRDQQNSIQQPSDILRGFIQCFKGGIAQEWLVLDSKTYDWMQKNLGYDRTQMGGQGGIIGNVMSVCNVQNVYVHCAALPEKQSSLFLDRPNLVSTDANGDLLPVRQINRFKDRALIHWILEFDKGDQIQIGDEIYTCPKSNRFIATYDPLNFVLHTDSSFAQAMADAANPVEYVILSGFQMLTHPLDNGESGLARIDEAWKVVESWKNSHPDCIVHFEFASTQDVTIRTRLLDYICKHSDSIGCNEQELIGALEVMHEVELAKECEAKLDSVSLTKGLIKLFEYTQAPRIQLHMFGMYITIQKPGYRITEEQNRDGMITAATIAAAKAGTGSIEVEENLLWAKGKEIGSVPVEEMQRLGAWMQQEYKATDFENTGIFQGSTFSIIATPTIIVEKPVTLVGMGDTISSLSLVCAR
jgi:ADP-dependent phosphofructokinase/glucokinase